MESGNTSILLTNSTEDNATFTGQDGKGHDAVTSHIVNQSVEATNPAHGTTVEVKEEASGSEIGPLLRDEKTPGIQRMTGRPPCRHNAGKSFVFCKGLGEGAKDLETKNENASQSIVKMDDNEKKEGADEGTQVIRAVISNSSDEEVPLILPSPPPNTPSAEEEEEEEEEEDDDDAVAPDQNPGVADVNLDLCGNDDAPTTRCRVGVLMVPGMTPFVTIYRSRPVEPLPLVREFAAFGNNHDAVSGDDEDDSPVEEDTRPKVYRPKPTGILPDWLPLSASSSDDDLPTVRLSRSPATPKSDPLSDWLTLSSLSSCDDEATRRAAIGSRGETIEKDSAVGKALEELPSEYPSSSSVHKSASVSPVVISPDVPAENKTEDSRAGKTCWSSASSNEDSRNEAQNGDNNKVKVTVSKSSLESQVEIPQPPAVQHINTESSVFGFSEQLQIEVNPVFGPSIQDSDVQPTPDTKPSTAVVSNRLPLHKSEANTTDMSAVASFGQGFGSDGPLTTVENNLHLEETSLQETTMNTQPNATNQLDIAILSAVASIIDQGITSQPDNSISAEKSDPNLGEHEFKRDVLMTQSIESEHLNMEISSTEVNMDDTENSIPLSPTATCKPKVTTSTFKESDVPCDVIATQSNEINDLAVSNSVTIADQTNSALLLFPTEKIKSNITKRGFSTQEHELGNLVTQPNDKKLTISAKNAEKGKFRALPGKRKLDVIERSFEESDVISDGLPTPRNERKRIDLTKMNLALSSEKENDADHSSLTSKREPSVAKSLIDDPNLKQNVFKAGSRRLNLDMPNNGDRDLRHRTQPAASSAKTTASATGKPFATNSAVSNPSKPTTVPNRETGTRDFPVSMGSSTTSPFLTTTRDESTQTVPSDVREQSPTSSDITRRLPISTSILNRRRAIGGTRDAPYVRPAISPRNSVPSAGDSARPACALGLPTCPRTNSNCIPQPLRGRTAFAPTTRTPLSATLAPRPVPELNTQRRVSGTTATEAAQARRRDREVEKTTRRPGWR